MVSLLENLTNKAERILKDPVDLGFEEVAEALEEEVGLDLQESEINSASGEGDSEDEIGDDW